MGTSLAGTDMDTAMDMALGSDMDARTDWVTDFPTVSQFTPNLLSQRQHLSPQPQLNPRILAHPPTLLLLLTVVTQYPLPYSIPQSRGAQPSYNTQPAYQPVGN